MHYLILIYEKNHSESLIVSIEVPEIILLYFINQLNMIMFMHGLSFEYYNFLYL